MAAVHAEVTKVLDMLTSSMKQEFSLVPGVDQQVHNITSNLISIQAVLSGSVERRQLDDATVRLWLNLLKTVTYDVDDIFDEWSYEILKAQLISRKVWSFSLLSACFCFRNMDCLHDRVAVKINDANARLDVIATDIDTYGISFFKHVDEHIEGWRGTTNKIDTTVKGREVEKTRLVNMLLAESGELPKIHLLSVVGMGGIGKTTLAQLVYNDETVKTHFDKRIWVSSPKSFDKFTIAKVILESLKGNTVDMLEFQRIAVEIQQSIKRKKVLLVLDDVWNEGLNVWKQLEDFLKFASSGSKILVTTRKGNVVKFMGCIDKDIFRIGGLSKENCWSFFCENAFYGWSSEDRQNLKAIGAEIVERCKGLPLAIKTIASLLCCKKSRQEWEDVLDSELWKFKEVREQIFSPLWLSYYDLSSPLKQCFLYCVIFPKGYRMSKDELISLWMAHGFLAPTKGKDMELVGHGYFHNLGTRCVFLDFEIEEKFNRLDKTYCNIHDVIHDFAKFVMEKDCLYIEVNSAEEVTSSTEAAYSDDVYHLHVKLGEKVEFPDSFYNLRKLRSLIVLPPKKFSLIGAALPKMFNQFTCLRSLSLSHCRLETIPPNINKLIHLRCLKLSKNYALRELPETICELHNLQTLSVNWCDGLIRFPKGVERLTNLRHLKNDYTYCSLPKGIGELIGLRKLLRITIDPKSKNAFSLQDLKNLNNISGSLTVFFMERERDTLVEDAKKAQLNEKKGITALSLNFPAQEWTQQQDEELVEALKLPPRLELLRITCYMGANSPSWISALISLKKLKLWYWSNCGNFPALAKLPCLEYIEFNNFGRVKKVAAEFYRMDGVMEASSSTSPLFPKLKHLQFMNMNEWEEWNDYDGDEEVMPSLRYLGIENCPKLKALPNFIRRKASLRKKIS